MNVDTKLVKELAKLLADTGLSEIEVEDGDRKIRVARQMMAAQQSFAAAPMPAPAAASAPASASTGTAAADDAAADLKSHAGCGELRQGR